MKISLNNPIVVGILVLLGAMSLYFNLGINKMIFPEEVIVDNIPIAREPLNRVDEQINLETEESTTTNSKSLGYHWETSNIRDPFNFSTVRLQNSISYHPTHRRKSSVNRKAKVSRSRIIDKSKYVPIIVIGDRKRFTEINNRLVEEGDWVNNKVISQITESKVKVVENRDTIIYKYLDGDK